MMSVESLRVHFCKYLYYVRECLRDYMVFTWAIAWISTCVFAWLFTRAFAWIFTWLVASVFTWVFGGLCACVFAADL